jgi:hypothetical protein
MSDRIEIQRVSIGRASTITALLMIAFMLIGTLFALASLVGGESHPHDIASLLLQSWVRGIWVWIVIVLALIVYNWIAKRFGGIVLFIRSSKEDRSAQHTSR